MRNPAVARPIGPIIARPVRRIHVASRLGGRLHATHTATPVEASRISVAITRGCQKLVSAIGNEHRISTARLPTNHDRMRSRPRNRYTTAIARPGTVCSRTATSSPWNPPLPPVIVNSAPANPRKATRRATQNRFSFSSSSLAAEVMATGSISGSGTMEMRAGMVVFSSPFRESILIWDSPRCHARCRAVWAVDNVRPQVGSCHAGTNYAQQRQPRVGRRGVDRRT